MKPEVDAIFVTVLWFVRSEWDCHYLCFVLDVNN